MAAHPGLVRVDLHGEQAWDLPDAPADLPAADGVRLLPYFDAFVVGSRPRHLLFPGRAAHRALVPSGQAGNYPVLLVDGVVAGVWHQKRSGRRVTVTVEPLRRLAKARLAALEEQVRRLGEIVEAEASLTVGPVSVGPHA
jgi:uracil-DNA glycosylase